MILVYLNSHGRTVHSHLIVLCTSAFFQPQLCSYGTHSRSCNAGPAAMAWLNKESAVLRLVRVGERMKGGRGIAFFLCPHARPLSGCFLCLTAPLAALACSPSLQPQWFRALHPKCPFHFPYFIQNYKFQMSLHIPGPATESPTGN